jgi:hypothetical protein
MPTDGRDDGDGGGSRSAAQEQYELLGHIQIVNFSANPPQVRPFGTTTISWEVRLPLHLHGQVTMVVAGNAVQGPSPGTLSGSATVSLDQSTEFGLTAETNLVSRTIGFLEVPVDGSECKPGSFPTFLLTDKIKQTIDQALSGRLRDNGSIVTAGDSFISIAIPLTLNSDGTMDISMELAFVMADPTRTGGEVVVTALNVTANVHFSGLASACEGSASQIAQAFMTEIANNQIVPGVQKGINDRIQEAEASAKAGDHPLHRDYLLTSFDLTDSEVTFMVCPTTPGVLSTAGGNLLPSQLTGNRWTRVRR